MSKSSVITQQFLALEQNYNEEIPSFCSGNEEVSCRKLSRDSPPLIINSYFTRYCGGGDGGGDGGGGFKKILSKTWEYQ